MHSWRSRLVALGLLMMGGIVACSAKTEPAGGLQLIVATNLLAPTDFDTVRLEVRQEVSQGQWSSPLIANDFRVPGETTLPTTFAIVAGTSANQNALIRVVALKNQRPLVLREVQIQIPKTRVAALTFVLASSCAGKLKVDATGSAQSACADALQSCQPDTGACGSSVIDPASLPNYTPGDENSVTVPPAGDASVIGDAADAAVDAGVDAPGEAMGAPSSVAAEPIPVAYVVTTLAGSGVPGFADGTGAAASFDTPFGIAVDPLGNLYLGDSPNHRIRKVTPAGVVTTFVGSGTPAFADGTGAAASFDDPHGVAVDAAGNVYVADRDNHRIRRVTPAGVVTTLAGSTLGYTDDTGPAARFNGPHSVAVDTAGNVYVTDTSNFRIRKITPAGVVTTLAGSTPGSSEGVGAAARFNTPVGVAVDGAGNVYIGDTYNYRIRKVTPAGLVTTLAGSTMGYADATGTAARFNRPHGVAVDGAGNVYVADSDNHRIRKVTPAGVVTTLAGSSTAKFADGTGAAASFDTPYGVAVDAAGNVYIGDGRNHRIRKATPAGIGQLAVTWAAPSTTGSSAITGYIASASAAGHPTRTCSAAAGASSCTISGLVSDVAYSVVVTASNAGGPGHPRRPRRPPRIERFMRGVNRREVDLGTRAEWSKKGAVGMHSWRLRLVALVLSMIVAIVACSTTTEPAGGLQLIVATNLLAPTDFDTVRLEVRQEVAPGQWSSPLIANDFRVPGETTLPTTFAIVAGKSANQNALIRLIAIKGQRPLVLREVQIQIPTTRVAALRFVLASSCAGKLKVDATGSAQSACADPRQSCQPDTGECGSTVVDPASLPNYNPGDENGVIVPPAGDANDADADAAAPDVDAAVPDADAAVPPCQLSKPFGAATALPSLNSIRDEGTAWLTVDENTIYFSREDAASDGGLVRRIYVATRTSRTSSFGVPALLQLDREAAAPVLTPDELVIYFQGGPLYLGDIYAATRPNNLSSFGASTLVAALNSSGDDSAGAFTASGAMYLTRGIANNYAIWKSTFSGSFDIPQMVIEIDTPNQEIRPVLTTDEKAIMFTSNRSGGKGNYDIWVATRPNISVAFGAATNVAELNTSSSELPSWISPDGCRIYFTSNRAGGAGGNDFYVAERPKL